MKPTRLPVTTAAGCPWLTDRPQETWSRPVVSSDLSGSRLQSRTQLITSSWPGSRLWPPPTASSPGLGRGGKGIVDEATHRQDPAPTTVVSGLNSGRRRGCALAGGFRPGRLRSRGTRMAARERVRGGRRRARQHRQTLPFGA
ncbi:hypothetical protein VFPFJ_08140 [Purpureocillium lilacinum]|uniref:Uncharacterized protein n=1 Tax=Purpureocillium lilacinum TaxID=33203 RepID=A0A179H840_PURLI|nr:hypothetical protein VFPFJ_08140 [Purpureocillium lilacinum]OAQ85751.1 hypothetical protein VFPFJ_08140 [Purpureocillium lilacinum]